MSGRAVPGGTSGLLERLLAAVRPEFRADVLVFDPEDPVFGSGLCLVDGCTRAVHATGMCGGHLQRWNKAGRPEISRLPDSVTAPWFGCAARRSVVPPAQRAEMRGEISGSDG